MKSNYLYNLERELYFVASDEERNQIIDEYEVHFEERMKDGATESEVLEALGTAKSVAIEYATELGISYSSFKKFLANFKRDSNRFIQKAKDKFEEVKSKLKNKNWINSTEDSSDLTASKLTDTDKTTVKSFLHRIFYLMSAGLIFFWRVFTTSFTALCGAASAFSALLILSAMIISPFLVKFTKHELTLWLLIYGAFISALVFTSILSIICFKRFRRKSE